MPTVDNTLAQRRRTRKDALKRVLGLIGGGGSRKPKSTTRPRPKARHPGRAYPKPGAKLVPEGRGKRAGGSIVGPPRVGMREVRGRGGRIVTVKRPGKRAA